MRAADAGGNTGPYSNLASATTASAGGGGGGPITFVQTSNATPQTPQRTVTVRFNATQVAGDLNVVVVGWGDTTAAVGTVTDSSGNVYRLAVGPTAISGTATQAIYYAANIVGAAAGANSVTVSFTAPAIYPDIRLAEYSGIDPNNPLDVVASATGNSAASATPPVTTTFANDLLVGANLVQSLTITGGSGFTHPGDHLARRRHPRGSHRHGDRQLQRQRHHCRGTLDHAARRVPPASLTVRRRGARAQPRARPGTAAQFPCNCYLRVANCDRSHTALSDALYTLV